MCVCGRGGASTCPLTAALSCSYLQRPIITVVMLPPPHQSHKSRQRPTYTWRAKHPVLSSAAHNHGSPIDRLLFKSSLLAIPKSFFLLFNFFSLSLFVVSVQCNGRRVWCQLPQVLLLWARSEREWEREVFYLFHFYLAYSFFFARFLKHTPTCHIKIWSRDKVIIIASFLSVQIK